MPNEEGDIKYITRPRKIYYLRKFECITYIYKSLGKQFVYIKPCSDHPERLNKINDFSESECHVCASRFVDPFFDWQVNYINPRYGATPDKALAKAKKIVAGCDRRHNKRKAKLKEIKELKAQREEYIKTNTVVEVIPKSVTDNTK